MKQPKKKEKQPRQDLFMSIVCKTVSVKRRRRSNFNKNELPKTVFFGPSNTTTDINC